MAQIYQANIQLIGSVDPSMAAATGLTLAQLKKLQQAIQTVNTMTNKSALAMPGLPPHLAAKKCSGYICEIALAELSDSRPRLVEILR